MLKKTTYLIELEIENEMYDYIHCKGFVDVSQIQNFFQFVDRDGLTHSDCTEIYMSNGTAVIIKESIETVSSWKAQAERNLLLKFAN